MGKDFNLHSSYRAGPLYLYPPSRSMYTISQSQTVSEDTTVRFYNICASETKSTFKIHVGEKYKIMQIGNYKEL